MRAVVLVLLAALAGLAGGEVENRDLIVRRDRGPTSCWIVSETRDEVRWRLTPDQGAENRTPRREIQRIEYAFQRQPGAWQQGMNARARGRYAESAELFEQLAQGQREAERVVGAFEAGVSWELEGKHELAAQSFDKVVKGAPNHPLALDARYRRGIALALMKNAEAEQIAQALEQDSRGVLGQQAQVRAAAVRAVIALQRNDQSELRRQLGRAAFNAELERAAWLHFNQLIADALRRAEQAKEAAALYERMLPQLADDPASEARVRLGLGLCRAADDRQGAILVLLPLDALPAGSPEQKCEARYHIGRLLWEEHQALSRDSANDERRSALAASALATARLLLQAAADAPVSIAAKTQAADLLKKLPAEPAAASPAGGGK
ncbi:MAG: hypothetical protein NZ552_04885 [Planctomycetes bacterium]|nr:hypothetical protein [Planctomycetota bacterium]